MKLGIKSKRIVVFLAMMSAIVLLGKAQSNLVIYHINEQFNSSAFNPAFLTSQKKFNFSIFPLAGMNLGTNNLPVIKDVMTQFLEGNQTTDDFKGVFNSLVKQDLFFLNYKANLLNLGYNSAFASFNFRISENVLLMTNFKGELSGFLSSQDFKNLVIGQSQLFAAQELHYREYSFGFAKEIIKKRLSVGVRAKIYFGKSLLFSEVSGKIIERADTIFTQITGPMRLSIPANPNFDGGYLKDLNLATNFDIGDYITNAKNIGTGVDLGFKYKITPEIEISASAIDLGRIKWKQNINTLIFNEDFPFPKNNIGPKLDENGAPMFDENGELILIKLNDKPLADTISFRLTVDEKAFSKPLPTTFYAGIRYQVNPALYFGMVDRFITTKELKYNSLLLSVNYQINKRFTISTGCSIIGNTYKNLPFALLYNWESGQSFIGSDNVLSFLIPSGSGYSGITFGTCFYLFRKKTKDTRQLEYLPYYQPKKSKLISKL
ncbi:MAG: DUF5723 family protein [Bacteroidota bacterium]|nr:DUF5723 family protein [Bacteroidota bacterium]